MRALQILAEEVRHLLFEIPGACYLCGRTLTPPILPWGASSPFCEQCLARIPWVVPPLCDRCGRPGSAPGLCRSCRTRVGSLKGRSLAVYTGVIKRLLTDLKFKRVQEIAEPLGNLTGVVASEVVKDWRSLIVVPIPLHRERLIERGFNQAELLAAGVARVLGRPMWPGILERSRATQAQSTLSASERWRNMEGAFSVPLPGRVAGRRFLLIDDVYTTGATMCAAAGALMRVGAAEVRFATVAVAVALTDVLDWSGGRQKENGE